MYATSIHSFLRKLIFLRKTVSNFGPAVTKVRKTQLMPILALEHKLFAIPVCLGGLGTINSACVLSDKSLLI